MMTLNELRMDERFRRYCSLRGDVGRHFADLTTHWKLIGSYAVGGLRSIGFAEASDRLLVTSSDGRGIFDCLSGEKIARDYDDSVPTYEDELRLLAPGFGPLEGQTIHMAGLHGGGLPVLTRDGWSLRLVHLDWSICLLILDPPTRNFPRLPNRSEFLVMATNEDIRTCGFSYTGNSFVIALGSHTLFIYRHID